MDKQRLTELARDYVENSEDNYISKDIAISEDVVGMKIFEAPLLSFGSADDEYFTLLKQPSVIGEHFMQPKDWLPNSRTVISFFLPFTEVVKTSNTRDMSWPSIEWLHARVEGQALVNKLCMYLRSVLVSEGYDSVVPALDQRYWSAHFTSNWSERHVAFVCGLGTFGLSKGLITQKGIAGRLGSIVTELYLPPDKREYEDIYEYCSMCGSCAKNCPANAISIENGKIHDPCSAFLRKTGEKHKPRTGCGKYQVGVPCESRIP
ncbi:MAG: 4Fe-4S binding protein [Bacillota bacterium]